MLKDAFPIAMGEWWGRGCDDYNESKTKTDANERYGYLLECLLALEHFNYDAKKAAEYLGTPARTVVMYAEEGKRTSENVNEVLVSLSTYPPLAREMLIEGNTTYRGAYVYQFNPLLWNAKHAG